uniref:Uncharacterized protein n=1 Tax=Meloidogyne enterolobii TaxID=390850 RepID=A0A6V7XW10_MELEN|nr:unnamed protein product [Meloidogyne enterolobii]
MYLVTCTCTCQSIRTCHLSLREPKSFPHPLVSPLTRRHFPHLLVLVQGTSTRNCWCGRWKPPTPFGFPLTRRHFPHKCGEIDGGGGGNPYTFWLLPTDPSPSKMSAK